MVAFAKEVGIFFRDLGHELVRMNIIVIIAIGKLDVNFIFLEVLRLKGYRPESFLIDLLQIQFLFTFKKRDADSRRIGLEHPDNFFQIFIFVHA